MALGNFELDIQKFVDKAKGNVTLVVRKIALDIFKRVIIKSPVGNPDIWKDPSSAPPGYAGGRFKSNWQVAIGSIPAGTLEVNDKGQAALSRVDAAVLRLKAGDIIYLVNNLDYARPLEYLGHSKQAPNGMVRITVLEFPQVVSKAANEVPK